MLAHRTSRRVLAWVLVASSAAGMALGCSDLKKRAQDIAREDPGLSLPAPNEAPKPGSGADGAAAPQATGKLAAPAPPPAAPEGAQDGAPNAADAADADEAARGGAPAADESPGRRGSTRPGRRRRSSNEAPGRAEPRAEPGDGAAHEEPAPAAVAAPGLAVTRLVVARGVSGREPVGVARSFDGENADGVVAFLELANEARAPSEVVVTFTPPGGGAPQRVRLEVGTERRWRTWARTRRARAPGTWAVSVRDAEGAVLARASFEVTK